MRIKKALNIQSNTKVDRLWDEDDLELCNIPVYWAIVVKFLQRFGKKMITYDNTFPLKSGHFYHTSR